MNCVTIAALPCLATAPAGTTLVLKTGADFSPGTDASQVVDATWSGLTDLFSRLRVTSAEPIVVKGFASLPAWHEVIGSTIGWFLGFRAKSHPGLFDLSEPGAARPEAVLIGEPHIARLCVSALEGKAALPQLGPNGVPIREATRRLKGAIFVRDTLALPSVNWYTEPKARVAQGISAAAQAWLAAFREPGRDAMYLAGDHYIRVGSPGNLGVGRIVELKPQVLIEV